MAKIKVTKVPESKRMDFLPEVFGERNFMRGENMVYDSMMKMCNEYTGGFWEYYKLSNKGFYMAPMGYGKMHLLVEGNYFDGVLSADAAGIVASLVAINQLVWAGVRELTDPFYHLRDFAAQHSEAAEIYSAID